MIGLPGEKVLSSFLFPSLFLFSFLWRQVEVMRTGKEEEV